MHIRSISAQQALPIRQAVLWPNKPREFCQVAGDNTARHYGVWVDGQLVCVASIYLEGNKARLRKFATLASHQGQGVGSALLSHMINELKALGVGYFWCDARTTAVAFYGRFGLVVEGEVFQKSGLSYFKMAVNLC